MADDWAREEVEAVVADYLGMLLKERRGEDVNKAEHNRVLRNVLKKRSKGSVEFKHQNVSAVLRDLGYPWIDGYKPKDNYQDLLRLVVEERLAEFPTLDEVIAQQVMAEVPSTPLLPDILSILVQKPEAPKKRSKQVRTVSGRWIKPRKPNYLEIEARNRSLGLAGEELVARFEQERLWRAGKKELSNRVDHVSKRLGDGFGYDILSFEDSGREKFIEVKTTQFGAQTPFFASRLEVDVSVELAKQYSLYRLYQFKIAPRLFLLPGSLSDSCNLRPELFTAAVK